MLLALLNADVLPVIPAQGSVGASGDLAPLAHLALALIGEGEATAATGDDAGANTWHVLPRDRSRARSRLQAKEGLALLNGTQLSLALALEGLFRGGAAARSSIVCLRHDGRRTRRAVTRRSMNASSTRAGCRARSRRRAGCAAAADRQRDPPQPRELRARAGSLRGALHAAGLWRGRSTRSRHARDVLDRLRSTAFPTTR